MHRAAAWPLALLVLCAARVCPARAEYPRISLKLENATSVEAAEALSKASGIALGVEPGAGAPPTVERASFDWTDVTAARASEPVRNGNPPGGTDS